MIAHVMDIGANYWSLWNFHHIDPQMLKSDYEASPAWFDRVTAASATAFARRLSGATMTAVTPVIGFANDGITGVPGVLPVSVESADGKLLKSGCLDAGYPLPGKIRQAQFVLPQGTKWQGLKCKGEIAVKGMGYPVRWACPQKRNDDGSLTLRPNLPQQV